MADINKKGQLTTKEAEEEIQGIVKYGEVTPLPHCYQRMKERNYDIHDITYILSTGKIRDPPEYDEKHYNWMYKVEGNVIEGDKAIVVVAIASHRELVCITIKPKG